jgi:hypothetical protein
MGNFPAAIGTEDSLFLALLAKNRQLGLNFITME